MIQYHVMLLRVNQDPAEMMRFRSEYNFRRGDRVQGNETMVVHHVAGDVKGEVFLYTVSEESWEGLRDKPY